MNIQILKQLCYNQLEDAIMLAVLVRESKQEFSEEQKEDLKVLVASFLTQLETSNIILPP